MSGGGDDLLKLRLSFAVPRGGGSPSLPPLHVKKDKA